MLQVLLNSIFKFPLHYYKNEGESFLKPIDPVNICKHVTIHYHMSLCSNENVINILFSCTGTFMPSFTKDVPTCLAETTT